MTDDQPPTPARPAGLELGPGRWARWVWVPAVPIVLALLAWWLTHPDELETSDATVNASTKVGRTVYVGVTGSGDLRQLHVREVEIERLAEGTGVEVEALVCHGGSISTTANPEPFCDSLEDAKGAELDLPRDQLIVGVTADSAQAVALKQIELSFREGLRWGTHPVGRIVVVDVVG